MRRRSTPPRRLARAARQLSMGFSASLDYPATHSRARLLSRDGRETVVLAAFADDDRRDHGDLAGARRARRSPPAEREARRDARALRRVRAAQPGTERTHDQRPRARRAARVPVAAAAVVLVLPGSGRGAVAAAGRRVCDRARVPGAAPDRPVHADLGVRAEPRQRHGPRSGDRLQPVRALPLPRGARGRRERARGDRAHAADGRVARCCSAA